MSDLSHTYNASETEKKWLDFWKEKKIFQADSSSSKPSFCIVIPPPNVTGKLHMGHALVNTLQDIQIRFKKMQGYETLWVPGTDHAGIATQTVVEKHLIETEGKRRVEYERKEFLEKIWNWKEKHEHIILDQLKKLGCSLDWSRLCFTMDEQRSHAVQTAFKILFDEGLIYQGDYLVNWDPVTQTALSDDEVDYEEKSGHIWTINYPLEDNSSQIQIATTRPETMLGDVAVAVHPKDERYTKLVGKKIRLPITGRLIPIITDPFVDPEFGTGAVKITPAHDFNDYEVGLRQNLEMINIMNPDGTLNEQAGAYAGLSMKEGRAQILDELKKQNLLVETKEHNNRVGTSYRSKAVIEPYLSKQWFLKISSFKDELLEMVENEVQLMPAEWKNTYRHWISNLKDWCISRQLWWGHQIPIYHNQTTGEAICALSDDLPEQIQNNPQEWVQDPDVLDTWFSSALWPFSTLGWPEKTADVEKFFPNSILITGHDILFFWVARMLFMGKHLMKKAPFPKVFLHGLIFGKSYWRYKEGAAHYVSPEEKQAFDKGAPLGKEISSKWEKMSKSKGNVIDPLEVIEEYGTDSMRLALASCPVENKQIDLDIRKFEDYKHFSNKIWNGSRFVLMNLFHTQQGDLTAEQLAQGLDLSLLELEDQWLLEQAASMAEKTTQALENCSFDVATHTAYDFFWNVFCAYYVEITKPTLFAKRGSAALRTNKQKVLLFVLLSSLKALHPIAPFITEEIFQNIKSQLPNLSSSQEPYCEDIISSLEKVSIAVTKYPTPLNRFSDKSVSFEKLQKLIHLIRNIRGEMKIPPQHAIDLYIQGGSDLIEPHLYILHAMVKINEVHFSSLEQSHFCSTSQLFDWTITIPMPKELQEQEKKRLEKEKEKLSKELEGLLARLSNEAFLEKAPSEVVEKMTNRKKEIEQRLLAIG